MGEDDLKVKENGNNTSPTNSDGEGLIIAPIEVIIPGVYSDDESEKEEDIKKKKKKKGKKNKVDKTMVLTKTFGQALRLINEQKVSTYLKYLYGLINQTVACKKTHRLDNLSLLIA